MTYFSDDILEGALKVLEKGEPLTIAAVARQLDSNVTTLRRKIGNKSALEQAVAMLGWQRLSEALKVGIEDIEDGRKKLKHLVGLFRQFVHKNPALYQVMIGFPLERRTGLQPVVQSILDDLIAILKPMGLTDEQVIHVFRVLRASIHGFVELELKGQFALDTPVEDSYQWLLKCLFDWF